MAGDKVDQNDINTAKAVGVLTGTVKGMGNSLDGFKKDSREDMRIFSENNSKEHKDISDKFIDKTNKHETRIAALEKKETISKTKKRVSAGMYTALGGAFAILGGFAVKLVDLYFKSKS